MKVSRILNFLFCVGLALAVILAIDRLAGETARTVLIDRAGPFWPLTIQNVMWAVFMIGLGQVWTRFFVVQTELRELERGYLPSDERTILQSADLPPIYIRLRQEARADCFLPIMIQRIITQFQTTHSIEQAGAQFHTSLELYLHEIDLRYSVLRYITWLIPTLGFIGTVIGISLALAYAGVADPRDPELLGQLTSRLAVAFNTTLLALILAAILVFLHHFVQVREERALNRIGHYCLDHLINRLYHRN